MNTDLSLTLAEEILKEKLKDIHFIRSDETYVRVLEAMEAYALERTQKWISVKDRPLFAKDDKGRWIATEDGDKEFIAALRYNETGKGEKWWIRHCVIEDVDGLCVVADDYNDPAGWHLEDVEYWMPLPEPPKE